LKQSIKEYPDHQSEPTTVYSESQQAYQTLHASTSIAHP